MKQVWCGVAWAAGCMVVTAAQAMDISAGTAESVTIRECRSTGTTACDAVSPTLFSQYGGLAGDTSSAAAVDAAGYGSASGSVALSGVVGAPILKARTVSEPGKRVNANSIALQRYQYTGELPTSRTFGGTLTYSQFSTGNYPVGPGAGVNAILEVFTLPTSTIPVGPSAADNFNMLFGGFGGLDGYTMLGDAHFADTTSVLNGTGTLGVTVTLNPGDAVWVWALLQSPATNGGWVDASHTLVTAWDNPAGLVPAAVAVPEPSAWLLGLLGGVALMGVTRRRPFSAR